MDVSAQYIAFMNAFFSAQAYLKDLLRSSPYLLDPIRDATDHTQRYEAICLGKLELEPHRVD